MIKQDSKLFSLRNDSTAKRRNYLLWSDSWFASQIRRTNGPQIGFLREEFGILDKIFLDGYLWPTAKNFISDVDIFKIKIERYVENWVIKNYTNVLTFQALKMSISR